MSGEGAVSPEIFYGMHEARGMRMDVDGSQAYGNGIGMEKYWGWGGNEADFHYRRPSTLYCKRSIHSYE